MAYTKNRTIDYNPSGTTVRNGVLYCDLNIDDLVSNLNTHEALTTGCHGVSTAGVIVGTTDTQTLTNKTLSSPVLTGTVTASGATITGGTIANVTLASPTLTGTVTASGATITGGTIGNSTLTGTLTATNATITGGTISTPTILNPTLTGTVTASSATITGTTLSNPTITGTVGASGGTIQSPTITGATITNSTIGSSNTFPTSSESTAGLAELATQAEVNAGTDDSRIVTPKKLLNTPMLYRKNLLINGSMQVAQKGSATVNGYAGYKAVDRWLAFFEAAGGSGNGYYATWCTNLSSGRALSVTGMYSTPANTITIGQRIEARDSVKIRAALSASKKLSVQFTLYHDIGSAQNVNISIHTADASDTFTDTTSRYDSSNVPVPTDTWTTVKYEGISPTNTDFEKGCVLYIRLSTPAGISNRAVYVGDVQLEISDTCTAFELVPFADDLARCQRYYCKTFPYYTPPAQNTGLTASALTTHVASGSSWYMGARWSFPQRMRVAPTITTYSTSEASANWWKLPSNVSGGGVAISAIGETGVTLTTSNVINSTEYAVIHVTADAEL